MNNYNTNISLVLFNSGLLFPCNLLPLLSVSFGNSFSSIKKDLVGSYILTSDYHFKEIVDVSVTKYEKPIFARLVDFFSRKVYFSAVLKEIRTKEEEDKIVNKFKSSMSAHVNKENNDLCVSEDAFILINTPRELYHSFIYPEKDDCLDSL